MGKAISQWGKMCKIQMVAMDKSLSDLSIETGYSRTYISAIINGRIVVPEETMQKISNALDVELLSQ